MFNVFVEKWKETIINNRQEILSLMDKKYGIDESKRPVKEGNAEGGWGIVGSFRKLAVD